MDWEAGAIEPRNQPGVAQAALQDLNNPTFLNRSARAQAAIINFALDRDRFQNSDEMYRTFRANLLRPEHIHEVLAFGEEDGTDLMVMATGRYFTDANWPTVAVDARQHGGLLSNHMFPNLDAETRRRNFRTDLFHGVLQGPTDTLLGDFGLLQRYIHALAKRHDPSLQTLDPEFIQAQVAEVMGQVRQRPRTSAAVFSVAHLFVYYPPTAEGLTPPQFQTYERARYIASAEFSGRPIEEQFRLLREFVAGFDRPASAVAFLLRHKMLTANGNVGLVTDYPNYILAARGREITGGE
jgi:hypothetical protein